MRYVFIAVLLSCNHALAATVVGGPPGLAEHVNGHQIREEKGITYGAFAAPNEMRPETYWPVFESLKGGALISVGTFRALVDASMGCFDWVFMVDYDNASTDFNRRHIALIKTISELGLSPGQQRFQYIAAMNLYWLKPGELRGLNESLETSAGPADEWQLVADAINRHKGMATARGVASSLPAWMSKIPLYFGGSTEKEERRPWPPEGMPRAVSEQLSSLVVPTRGRIRGGNVDVATRINFGDILMGGLIMGDERKFTTPHRRAARFYWESDGAWKKIVALIKAGRIVTLTGDLTGGTTLKDIGTALRAAGGKGAVVKAVDVSNAMSYFWRVPKVTEAENMRAFMGNLDALPMAPDAAILFSALRNEKRTQESLNLVFGSDPKWHYFAVPFTQFKEVTSEILRPPMKNGAFEKTLLETARTAQWSADEFAKKNLKTCPKPGCSYRAKPVKLSEKTLGHEQRSALPDSEWYALPVSCAHCQKCCGVQ